MRRSLKLILLLSLALVFALSIVACNDAGKTGDTSLVPSASVPDGSVGGSASANAPTDIEIPEGYKEVKEFINVNEFAANVGAVETDLGKGIFTIQTGGPEIRSRSKSWTKTTYPEYSYIDVYPTLSGATSYSDADGFFTYSLKLAANKGLKIKSPGNGYVCVYVQNGSSGATEQKIAVNGYELAIPGNSDKYSSPLVQVSFAVQKGEYVITRPSGTVDLYYAEIHCAAVDSKPTGISLAKEPQTNFITGMDFTSGGYKAVLNFEDGTTEDIAANEVTIDSSAVKMNEAGEYTVSVSARGYGCEYTVKVSDLDDAVIGFNADEKLSKNSAAGNSVYYNHRVRRIYSPSETLDLGYLSVKAVDKDGNEYPMALTDKYVTKNSVDLTTAGTKAVEIVVEIGGISITNTFFVTVVDTPVYKEGDIAVIKVDGAFEGVEGAVTEGDQKGNTFTSIGQALEYLMLNKDAVASGAIIYIAEGYYFEKLEVELPGLTFIGTGADASKVVIEWDSLYGDKDESGFSQVTDSTQTVAVRDGAVNCTFDNLTISNYWNSKARFDERADAATCDHRALALLVQSDKFTMKNCRLLGYQDTVEFFTGRQLIYDSYIEGVTDFIFGTNGTTYFYNCEIHSGTHVKGDAGYLTAMKGCNKGDADAIKYGIIFDRCNFTSDDTSRKNAFAIGRTWGKYAAVAVINSTLGDHISTAENGGSSNKYVRYITMNAPVTDDTVQFVEYNNTGAGALSAASKDMTYLTAEEAADYSDLSVIFGTTNGNVAYADAWTPAIK